jgi:hypothetical protein
VETDGGWRKASRWTWFSLIAFTWVVWLPRQAEANSRYPNANQLVVDPHVPSRLIVRTSFGVLVSTDAGAHWQLICETAFAGAPQSSDQAIGVTDDGSILVANKTGVSRGQDGGCSWAMGQGALAGLETVDVTVSRSNQALAYGIATFLGDAGFYVGQAARSDDNGQTWTATGPPIADFSPLTIDVAPSDPSIVYASGTDSAAASQFFYRSSDSGATWAKYSIPGEGLVFIAAVDPVVPDTVYIRTDADISRLLVSDNGGQDWRELYRDNSSLVGFAISPDGQQVAVGSYSGGLVLLTRNGSDAGAWLAEKIRPLEVACLTWTAAGLYACDFMNEDGFSVGFSVDGRQPFAPLVLLAQIVPMQCPDHPLPCASDWCATTPALATDPTLQIDAGCTPTPVRGTNQEMDAASTGSDGPSDANATSVLTPSGGCGCHTSRNEGGRVGTLAILLLGTVSIWRIRRRSLRVNESTAPLPHRNRVA